MTHHDKARELVELVRAALTFCNAAAGEGLEIDGLSPEDFLMSYSGTTGFEDWDRIGDHAADLITALAEENQRLREALLGMVALYDSDEGTRNLPEVVAARAALSSTGGKG